MDNHQDNDKQSYLLPTIFAAARLGFVWMSIDLCHQLLEGVWTGIVPYPHHTPHGKLKIFFGLIAFLCLTPGIVGEDGLGAIQKTLKKVITWHGLWEQKIANWVVAALFGALGWAYFSGVSSQEDYTPLPGTQIPLSLRAFGIAFFFFMAMLLVPFYLSVLER